MLLAAGVALRVCVHMCAWELIKIKIINPVGWRKSHIPERIQSLSNFHIIPQQMNDEAQQQQQQHHEIINDGDDLTPVPIFSVAKPTTTTAMRRPGIANNALNRKRRVEFTTPPLKEQRSPSLAEQIATATTTTTSGGGGEPMSRRPNDIVYQVREPPSSIIPPSLEPSTLAFSVPARRMHTEDEAGAGMEDGSISMSNVLPLETYNQAQRMLIERTIQASFTIPTESIGATAVPTTTKPTSSSSSAAAARANVSAASSSGVLQSAFSQALQPAAGVSIAAYANHFTRTTINRAYAAGDGVASLRPTPYVDNSASTFVTTFVQAAIEEAPNENAAEHIPSDEQRACSTAVLYDWAVSFQRSVRPGEFACSKGDRCWGNTLLDDRRRPIPKSTWPVFWFPEEIALVRSNPEKMKAEAVLRVCIGCKWADANALTNHAAMRNTRVGTNWTICNAHVLVNVKGDGGGEFPIECTQGLCSNGYRGLSNQVPLSSRIGWSAVPDPHFNGCYLYTNSNMHRFPIPPEYYHRDAPPTALPLSANQSAPVGISSTMSPAVNAKRGF